MGGEMPCKRMTLHCVGDDDGAASALLSVAEAGMTPQVGAAPAAGLALGFTPGAQDCLLVIDVQNDFMDSPPGALPVPGGADILPLVNALVAQFACVVYTQDWHPAGHSSFASQHAGKAPYDEVQAAYGAQTLWPDHCVQGSAGARLHAELAVPERAHVLRKGFRPGPSNSTLSSLTYHLDGQLPVGSRTKQVFKLS